MLDKLEFLARQQSAGKLDSSGHFTVAWDKAEWKLGQSRLPRPSAWILKVVQAAVVADAPVLRIRQGRRSTEITFQPACLPTMEELRGAVETGGAGGRRDLEHLVIALSSLGPGQARAFTVVLKGDGRTDQLVWDGEPKVQSDVSGFRWSKGITLNVRVGARRAAQAADEAEELRKYAHLASCRVYLDSRRICPVIESAPPDALPPKFHWPYSFRDWEETAYLALGSLPSSAPFSPFTLPGDVPKRARRRALTDRATDARPFLVRLCEGPEVSALWRLDFRFEGRNLKPVPCRSYCRWLKDGVVILEEVLPEIQQPVALTLYLNASDWETDISGFQFQSSTAATRAAAVREMARAVGVELGHLLAPVQNTRALPGLSATALVAGGTTLMILPFAIFPPMFLGLLPCVMISSVADLALSKRMLLEAFHRGLEDLQKCLQQAD